MPSPYPCTPLRQRLDVINPKIARHDGDGDGKSAGHGPTGEGGNQRSRSRGLGGRAEHQHGYVLVVVDLSEDLFGLLALADHLLGRHAVEALVVELAPEEAEQRARLV